LFVKTIQSQKMRHIAEQRNIENDLDYVDGMVYCNLSVFKIRGCFYETSEKAASELRNSAKGFA